MLKSPGGRRICRERYEGKLLELLRKIRQILSPRFKWGALLLIVMMGIGALLELIGLALIMPVVSVFAESDLLQKNHYLNMIYRWYGAESPREFILISAVVLIVFYILKNLYAYAMVCCQSRYSMALAASLADRMYRNYIRAPYSFHLKVGASEQLSRLNQVYDFTMGLLLPLMLVCSEFFVFAAIVGMIFWVMPVIGLCSLGFGVLAFILFYLPLKKLISKYGKMNYDASLELLKNLTQGLGAVKEVKLTCSEDFFAEEVKRAQIRRNHAQKCVSDIGQIPRFAIECFAVGAAMIILIILLMMQVSFSGILVAASFFVAAMSRLLPSFSRMQYNLLHVRSALYIFDVIYKDLTSIEQENLVPPDGKNVPLHFQNSIRVEHVDFSYSPDLPPVLKDVNLEIKRHECVAFVGKTGSGKSTLADVIMGFLEPQQGRVLTDGTDIRENLCEWRRKIGYVPQNIHLFDDTIRSNIAFGVP